VLAAEVVDGVERGCQISMLAEYLVQLLEQEKIGLCIRGHRRRLRLIPDHLPLQQPNAAGQAVVAALQITELL
jgi:hypothetical protein